MARTLNQTELASLDAMIERTSVPAVVSAIATYCSIKARQCSVFSNPMDTWETRANILNNAVDTLPRKPRS